MSGRRGVLSLLLALATVATSWWGASQSVVEPTTAAWTDRTDVSATVAAGTWRTTTAGSCVAYGVDHVALDGCRVGAISFEGWGDAGSQVRNYYLSFAVPAGTRAVSFDVDLRTGTGIQSPWSWDGAHVLTGGQFTPREGWTCSELPRVRGNGADWQNPLYFQVAERAAGGSSACP